MLWSYGDLMGLRIIHWLRRPKKAGNDNEHFFPPTALGAVRRALAELAELDMGLWSENRGPAVRVDGAGGIHIATRPSLERAADRQRSLGSTDEPILDVLAPFATETTRGPDLIQPRPHLRIVPGKLAGSPHIEHTRVESQAVGALAGSGLPTAKIYRLYPDIEPRALDDAVDLEEQLAQNLGRKLAA
jgi:uncharacterized protein (DUF433 family)